MPFRRALSAVGSVLRVVLLTICVLVGLTLVALHTGFVRVRLLDWAEGQLEERVAGDVELGTLRGILLHRLTLSGIEVRDAEGEVVLDVGSLTVDIDPRALILDGTIRIDEATIERPVVTLGTAPIFETDTATARESGSGGFSPIPIIVETLRVRDGRFVDRRSGHRITDLDLVGSGRIGRDQIRAEIDRLALTPSAYPSRVELFASDVVLTEDRIRAGKIRFADELGSYGHLDAVRIDFDDLTLSAEYLISVAGESVGRIVGDDRFAGRLRLEGAVGHAGPLAPWTIQGEGELATAPLTLSATASPDLGEVAAAMEVAQVDPRRIHPEAPQGLIGGAVDARVSSSAPGSLTGAVEASLQGRFRNGSNANAELHIRGRFTEEGFELTRSNVKADVDDIRDLLPPSLPVSGSVRVDADVEGPLSEPSGRATIEGSNVRIGSVRIEDLDARLRRREGGPWHLRLSGSGAGPVRWFALSAVGRYRAQRLWMEVSRLRVRAADQTWVARGRPELSFEPKKRLEIRRLDLTGGESRIGLAAVLSLREGRVRSANLEVPHLDLAVVRAFLPGDVKDMPKAGLSAVAGIDGRAAHAEVSVFGPSIGHGVVKLEARTPQRSLSLAAWRRRGLTSVVSASSTLARLNVENLLRAFGQEPEVQGVLSGSLAAGMKGRPLTGMFYLEDVVTRGLPVRGDVYGVLEAEGDGLRVKVAGSAQPSGADPRWPRLDVAATGRWARGRLEVEGSLDAREAGRVEVRGILDGPADPLAPEGWRQLGLRSVRTASATVVQAELGRWADLLDAGDLEGEITGGVLMLRGGRLVQATAKLKNVEIPDFERPLDGQLFLSSKAGRTRASAALFHDGWPALTAKVTAPRSATALVRMPRRVLARVPLEGQLTARAFPVATLSELLDAGGDAGGHVSLEGSLSGSWSAPRFDLVLTSDDARVRGSVFERIQAKLQLTRSRLVTEALMRQRRGGRLKAEATIGLGSDRSVSGELDASDFDLRFLSLFVGGGAVGGVGGVMDADMSLSGERADPRLEGRLLVDNLRAVLVYPIPPVEKTHLELRLGGDEQVVLRADGQSGDGTFELAGQGSLPALTEPQLAGGFRMEDVSVAIGPRLAELDLEADWSVKTRDEILALNVTVTDGDARLPKGAADELLPIETFERVRVVDSLGEEVVFEPAERMPEERAKPRAFQYRVTLQTEDPIPVRSSDLNASVAADLTVESSPEGTIGRGTVQVSDGTIELFGRRWYVDRAVIRFPGQAEEEPRIDISLHHDFTDVVVYVNVSGTPSDPTLDFASEPPGYSRDQLLGFVLGGDPGAASPDGTIAGQAAGIAAGFLMGKIQGALEDKLPIDTLSVAVDDGATASAVTLGKWITDRIFLSYNYALEAEEDENRNEATLRVLFGAGWMIEAAYGDRGIGGADVLWIKRF